MLQRELRDFREVPCPGVYLALLETAKPVRSELLDREAAHHGAINHCPPKCTVRFLPAAREVAHESPGEGIARTRRVMRVFKRKRRNTENAILVHEHGTIFAALYDQRGGAHPENMSRGAQ